jgi:predicted negative regulator of RcsB-dependent stress response
LLAGNDAGAFTSAFGEVLGDAYTALGRIAEAQDAYQKVLSDPASQITIDRQIVQWKSLDLPEVTAEEAEPAPAAAVEAEEADSEEGE